MTVVAQFIRMRRDWHEQAAFLARWRTVPGVDGVRIKDEDIGLPAHRTFEPHARGRVSLLPYRRAG